MQAQTRSPTFIIGCPRSGTTLLQSLLTAHPKIASFPESHFFNSLIPKQNNWRRKLLIASCKAKPRFKEFLNEIEHQELQKCLPILPIFMIQYVRAFTKVLDTLTQQQGKSIWLEKTPIHLHHISYIEKFLPEAKFIHVIRNGTDVVASLYEVTHKYPEAWDGERDIDTCIHRWIKDVKISLSYLHKSNHALIRYEDLVGDTNSVIKELCNFIGVNFTQAMLDEYGAAATKVSLKSEPWKASVNQKIRSTSSEKFDNLFDDNQRKYIVERLSVINLQDTKKSYSYIKNI